MYIQHTMATTYRLSDLQPGKITPFLVWSEHYGEVLALIRSWCHCDEDTAADLSHDLYVTAQRTGFLGRWKAGGVPLPVWLIGRLRSQLSAVRRHPKALDVADNAGMDNHGAKDSGFLEAEISSAGNTIREKFAGRLHERVFPLLRSEHTQVMIARKLRVSNTRVCAVVAEIRGYLKNRL
jgi:hypothetical protein